MLGRRERLMSWKRRGAPSRKRSRCLLGGPYAIGDQQNATWSEIRVQAKRAIEALQRPFFLVVIVVELMKL